jgi:pilus assembly protein CpaC
MKQFIFFLYFLLSTKSVLGNTEKTIYLSPGQEWQISPSVARTPLRLKAQKTSILQILSGKKTIQVKALKLGQTHLLLNDQFFHIVILPPADLKFIQKIQTAQKDFLGLKLIYQDKKIQLHGTLYKISELTQISSLQQEYKTQFENHMDVANDISRLLRAKINSELVEQKLSSENLLLTKPWSIRVQNKENAKTHLKILEKYGVVIVQDTAALEVKPLIKVEIAVAEIKNDFKRTLGVKWPTSFSAELLGNGGRNYGDLIFQADALENQGFGKILAKPNILCRSGSEAEFLAGGEFPIKILNFKSQDVIWKRYGVLLKVKPQADQSGRISLQLNTEISSIDMSKAVDGVPGLFTNRVSSHFDLNQSQTIALSGMIKSENQGQSQGLPWLSQIPVLGSLFSSKDFIENKSELVIFVRPSLVLKEENL